MLCYLLMKTMYKMLVMHVCTFSNPILLILDHNGNDDTDIIDLSAAPVLIRVELLDLLSERSIPLGVGAGSFGFSNNIGRQQRLQGILVLLRDPTILCEFANCFRHSSTFFPSLPSLEPSHLPAYDFQ